MIQVKVEYKTLSRQTKWVSTLAYKFEVNLNNVDITLDDAYRIINDIFEKAQYTLRHNIYELKWLYHLVVDKFDNVVKIVDNENKKNVVMTIKICEL